VKIFNPIRRLYIKILYLVIFKKKNVRYICDICKYEKVFPYNLNFSPIRIRCKNRCSDKVSPLNVSYRGFGQGVSLMYDISFKAMFNKEIILREKIDKKGIYR